jgi:hypothetical protein
MAATSEEDVARWAKDWQELAARPFGESYNSALERLTNRFTGAEGRLSQVRTNDNAQAFPAREGRPGIADQRQFRLNHYDPLHLELVMTPLFRTPHQCSMLPRTKLGGQSILSRYMQTNAARVLDDPQYTLDDVLHSDTGDFALSGGVSFATKIAHQCHPSFGNKNYLGFEEDDLNTDADPDWMNRQNWTFDQGALDPDTWARARRKLALNTCNGCHSTETGTNIFHMFPKRAPQTEVTLSEFLTKRKMVRDPISGRIEFRDEIGRRAKDLGTLVRIANTDAAARNALDRSYLRQGAERLH